MPSPKTNPASTIVDATAKTRSVIEGLQAKLAAEAEVRGKNGGSESIEELERQLQAYFERTAQGDPGVQAARRSPVLDELRSRVIDRVVDRILADWADVNSPGARSALAQQVIERLTERLLDELQRVPSL